MLPSPPTVTVTHMGEIEGTKWGSKEGPEEQPALSMGVLGPKEKLLGIRAPLPPFPRAGAACPQLCPISWQQAAQDERFSFAITPSSRCVPEIPGPDCLLWSWAACLDSASDPCQTPEFLLLLHLCLLQVICDPWDSTDKYKQGKKLCIIPLFRSSHFVLCHHSSSCFFIFPLFST